MTDGPPESIGREDFYILWKDWSADDFGLPSPHEQRLFSAELGRAGRDFPPGTSVLEIGFGNGAFLSYARKREWDVVGTEANPALVERALRKGYEVHLATDLEAQPHDRFDLVVAFDVLEHIPLDRLGQFMANVRRILRPEGVFIARFPNGDSPFGLANQYGDLTHVTVLGSGRAAALARQASLRVKYLAGAAESHGAESLASKVLHWIAMRFRSMLERFVQLVLYDRAAIAFCSRNLTLVCERGPVQDQASGGA